MPSRQSELGLEPCAHIPPAAPSASLVAALINLLPEQSTESSSGGTSSVGVRVELFGWGSVAAAAAAGGGGGGDMSHMDHMKTPTESWTWRVLTEAAYQRKPLRRILTFQQKHCWMREAVENKQTQRGASQGLVKIFVVDSESLGHMAGTSH